MNNPNKASGAAYKVILANNTTGAAGGISNNVNNVKKMTTTDCHSLAIILQSRQRQDFTREWVRKSIKDYLIEQEEMGKEEHAKMLRELQSKEIYYFNCFFSITENQFMFLVRKLKEKITKYNPQRHKKFFTAEERLSITLKYLATGEFNSCRNYCFRATKPVILNMISRICLDMYEALKDDFIATPKTESEWQMVSKEFMQKTNLTNCLGDLTMKHIVSKSSKPFSQKTEFNSDNTLVFTSLVDSNENFIYVDISKTKSYMNDPTVFENSEIKAKIERDNCFLPATGKNNLPYYFTTNSRLGLPKKTYLMKCRNESQIESHRDYEFYEAIKQANQKSMNALKYISNIFGAFTYPLKIDLENGRNILLGAIALYNFLRKTEPGFYQICENIKNYHEEEIPKEKMQDYDYLAKPVVFLHDCFQNLCTQLGDDSFEETDEINRNALMDLCFKKSCET